MKKLLDLLAYLVKPFAIGIYLTIGVTVLAFFFYARQGNVEDDTLLTSLNIAHQKSVDMRLKIRGPRKGSDQVALLAIDEKAVSTIGRWPWPREVFARAVDNALKYGVKVLAFDIVFSEPSAKPAEALYEKLKAGGAFLPQLDARFREELQHLDSDRILAETIAKHADHIVLGSFNNAIDDEHWAPYINFCLEANFSRSRAYKIWKNDAVLLSPIGDRYTEELPSNLKQLYAGLFDQIEAGIREKNPPAKNATDELDLREKVESEILKYCHTMWLDPQKDEFFALIAESWPELKKQEPDAIKEDTYEQWAAAFKERIFPIATKVSQDWVMNIDSLSSVAKHTAYFNATQDSDGTVRRSALVARTHESSWFPSLPLKAFLVANNFNLGFELAFDNKFTKRVIKRMYVTDNETGDEVFTIPTDISGQMAINYAGKQQTFAHMSMAELLTDSDEAEISQRIEKEPGIWVTDDHIKVKKSEWLKDKIFIVGATATGIYDLRVTPFDENFPGPETHVNVIDNLLRRDFLQSRSDEEFYMLLFLPIAGLLLSVALTFLGAVSGAVLTAISLATIGLFDRFYLFGNGYVITIIFPFLLVGVLYIGLTFYKYFTEERGKKELRATFQKYVSPAIVEEILAHPTNIELGGRKMHLTVFFSDVRGFTTISEKLDPQALSDLLNAYLTPMTDLVFKNKGTLDKYMGDAIMAFFGAPIAYKDHAKWACRCCLQSLVKLKELQDAFEKQGLPSIDIGIGLNTGEVSVGNMGSESVRNYTVMGDAVNLASRLEGINKTYGTRIIISEFTYEEVKDAFICREVDWVRVKGKVLPVKIYELIAEKTAPQSVMNLLKWFDEGYKLYHERGFAKAIEAFSKGLEVDPSDYLSKVYVKRCQDFIVTPPPADWDGVFVMTSK